MLWKKMSFTTSEDIATLTAARKLCAAFVSISHYFGHRWIFSHSRDLTERFGILCQKSQFICKY